MTVGFDVPTRPTIVVSTVGALRAGSSSLFVQGMSARVASTWWTWSAASTATDDGVAVVKPADVSGAGRWLVEGTTMSARVASRVGGLPKIVDEYGADPTGVADSTTAIRDADADAHDISYLGTYKVTGDIGTAGQTTHRCPRGTSIGIVSANDGDVSVAGFLEAAPDQPVFTGSVYPSIANLTTEFVHPAWVGIPEDGSLDDGRKLERLYDNASSDATIYYQPVDYFVGNGAVTTLDVSMNGLTLPRATIAVASTTSPHPFSGVGHVYVATSAGTEQLVTYSSTDGTHFFGCSGGTGTMSTGGAVEPVRVLGTGKQSHKMAPGARLVSNFATDHVLIAGGGFDAGSFEVFGGLLKVKFSTPVPGGANIVWFGANGDKVTDNSAALTRAAAASPDLLFPDGGYVLTSGTYGTSGGTTHHFQELAYVIVNGTDAVVLPGDVDAADTQLVAQVAYATASFALPDVSRIPVEWLGARVNDPTYDSHDGIILTARAFGGKAGVAVFGDGIYTTTLLDFDQDFGQFGTGIILQGAGAPKVGVSTGGTVVRAFGTQTKVFRGASQFLNVASMTFDGDFKTTQCVVHVDQGTTQATYKDLVITRGHIDAFTFTSSGDVITAPGNTFSDGQEVFFNTTVGLFSNFVANTSYFVRDVGIGGAGTFKISATSGGAVFTLGTPGSGTETVTATGTCLMQLGSATNPQCDTSLFQNIALVQDFLQPTHLIGTGVLHWGTNTLRNTWIGCSVFYAFDGHRFKNGGGGSFLGCTVFGEPAISRAAWVLDGFSQPVHLDGHYLESDALPMVKCINDPGVDSSGSWYLSGGHHNSPRGDIVWTKRQPLECTGNAMGGFYRFTDLGTQRTVIVGDTFTDEGGAGFHGFSGSLANVTRIAASHVTTGDLPNLFPAGADASAHLALGANSTGVDIGVGGTSTIITGDTCKVVGELLQSPDTGRSMVRLVSSAGAFSEFDLNLYFSSGYKYARTGGAAAISIDASTGATAGDIVFSTAPSGSVDAAATLTEQLRIKRAGDLQVGGFIDASGKVVQLGADVNNVNLASNYDVNSGLRVRAGGGGLVQVLAVSGFAGRYQFFTFANGSAGVGPTLNLGLQIDDNGDVTIVTRLITPEWDRSGSLKIGATTGVINLLGAVGAAGGAKVISIADRTTAPTTTPTGGGVLYSEAGAITWKGSSGTVTTLAPA